MGLLIASGERREKKKKKNDGKRIINTMKMRKK